ncbi:hypothetical protein LguiA_001204 [Lonicera macranthoides]
MKDFAGTPGTLTGLILRMSQCLFAAASIASMASAAKSFFSFTAFCYLIASMGIQIIWSLGLAFMDAYALVKKKVFLNPSLVSLFVVGDWVTATLTLAAASSSAGIVVLLDRDLGVCITEHDCPKYQMAVAFAFLSWGMTAISAVVMFWILGAG